MATRAMTLLAADPARAPRSLTVHYLEAAQAGPVAVTGVVERAGRSTTAVSLRFEQGGRPVALALGALATWREGARELVEGLRMPAVPPPQDVPAPGGEIPGLPPFTDNYDYRWAAESDPAIRARVGGWLRTRAPRPADPVALAAFRSRRVGGGAFEEDGELWSRDGVLLAQSRQLALLREGAGAAG